MKKLFILGAALFGTIALSGANLNSHLSEPVSVVYAEEETPVETECYVTIAETKNGTITVDKTEGNIGDIVSITAKHDLFYLVKNVSVNGVDLIESEETSGLFTFALVAGENLISATFAVDQDLLGELSVIYEQAKNKDWTNLFTLENVLRIVSWVLEGGILIAVIRYFVKDKKLEKKLEETVSEKINQIIPETTVKTVKETVETVATPIFTNLNKEITGLKQAIGVMAECYALQQEGTPESKIAIIQALKRLNLGENITFENVENYIKDLEERVKKTYEDVLAKLDKISGKEEEKGEEDEKTVF